MTVPVSRFRAAAGQVRGAPDSGWGVSNQRSCSSRVRRDHRRPTSMAYSRLSRTRQGSLCYLEIPQAAYVFAAGLEFGDERAISGHRRGCEFESKNLAAQRQGLGRLRLKELALVAVARRTLPGNAKAASLAAGGFSQRGTRSRTRRCRVRTGQPVTGTLFVSRTPGTPRRIIGYSRTARGRRQRLRPAATASRVRLKDRLVIRV